MPLTTQSTTRLALLLLTFVFPVIAFGQPKSTSPQAAVQVGSVRIAWEGRPKINRYRLQLARNEQFTDIVFDKVVDGREYTVTEIPSGNYFWRVAPAASETGRYSKPLPVVVSASGVPDPTNLGTKHVLSPPADIGWRTATGFIEQPIAAKLRAESSFDIIGVNSFGMVYAIDGQKGISLWSSRYRPGARKGEPVNSDGGPQFVPLLIESKDRPTNVVVAFDSGVRALEGASGREIWRHALPGEAIVGISMNAGKDGPGTVVIFDNSHAVSFLKEDSGQLVSQTKLDGLPITAPIAITVKNERCILIGLDNGLLDVINLGGVIVLSLRLDAKVTASPVIVQSSHGSMLMLGTDAGLVALDAATLNPLWRVATSPDVPIGSLASSDLDSDGSEEVTMITRNGRIVIVNIGTGKIQWVVDSETDANRVAFADMNGDGVRDVLVAGGAAFALGYSGKDGTLIWKADGTASSQAVGTAKPNPRQLIAGPFGENGSALLAGSDPDRTGLSAVGLPAGALK